MAGDQPGGPGNPLTRAEAGGPLAGRAQRALDLSQGHFSAMVFGAGGDYADGDEIDIARFGPFTLIVDYAKGRAVKLMDPQAFRKDPGKRRLARLEFDSKVAQIISESGAELVASWGDQ